jgi:ABC-type microcin C transport system duplicated ATPase subunit YejF
MLELLELVGIQNPRERLKAYPHQLRRPAPTGDDRHGAGL